MVGFRGGTAIRGFAAYEQFLDLISRQLLIKKVSKNKMSGKTH